MTKRVDLMLKNIVKMQRKEVIEKKNKMAQ